MGEPFKNLIDRALVRTMAAHLARVHRSFDRARFQSLASDGLEGLELKARALHVASALEATLPRDFGRAAAILEKSLAPARLDDDLGALSSSELGLAGWPVWPMGEFVVRRGMREPERALAVLHALTQRFSAEFALRPFLVRHPALAFATIERWARDPSPHVRRLVSEGSRPRLPWGMRLNALVADPAPTLPLLRVLQDDPSAYVRRSVANHLNDISKDHPHVVSEWLARHLPRASSERRALLRHASRTLIKQGHAPTLAAWGLGRKLRGSCALSLAPRRVEVGGSITLNVALVSRSASPQRLVVDYVVHHVRANGGTSPKVFKGWTIELGARARLALEKRHSLAPVTTRRYHAGRHRVELKINGEPLAERAFELRLPARARDERRKPVARRRR